MARKWQLTWQTGRDRHGRWKKIYRGVCYYFEGGNGKTDKAGYQNALRQWQDLKTRLDSEAAVAKPYRADYQAAISEWEAVLAWAREQGDTAIETAAAMKRDDLCRRLEKPAPPPLGVGDRPTRRDQLNQSPLLRRVSPELQPGSPQVTENDAEEFCDVLGIPDDLVPVEHVQDLLARILTAKTWNLRVDEQKKKKAGTVPLDQSIKQHVDDYVKLRGSSGISPGAVANIARQLAYFRDHLGGERSVEDISAKAIDEWHTHLMKEINTGRFSGPSAKNIQQTVRAWVRWLWERKAIQDLPRNIGTPLHRIRIELKPVKVTEMTDVRKVYDAAAPSMKLYILLAINCGMTQVDISDLRPDQIDWKKATLTRKRGKTKHVGTVPTVVYPLWPETLKLLQDNRSKDPNRLLLAPGGGPLKYEVRRGDKTVKHDYVGLMFRRLMKRLDLDSPFKSLKKTSASLLRDHKDYIGLEGLFLDHAPRSTSDKHYAAPPLKLFAKAVEWLRQQYRLSGVDLADA